MTRRDDAVPVPPALQARVDAALGSVRDASEATLPAPAEHLAAGEALLGTVLRGEGRDRATALDLLAADALVTHAFELAAAEPASLEELARGSMRRIAALVDA